MRLPPAVADDQLDIAGVAALLGIQPRSVLRARQRGALPDPDGHLGRSPWWWRSTIDAWLAGRRAS